MGPGHLTCLSMTEGSIRSQSVLIFSNIFLKPERKDSLHRVVGTERKVIQLFSHSAGWTVGTMFGVVHIDNSSCNKMIVGTLQLVKDVHCL